MNLPQHCETHIQNSSNRSNMSAVQESQVWTTIPKKNLNSKYEKCLNITEEIYKRINITFQIKKLETREQSDLSDLSEQLDSNELSNETDLFACDKSTSIPSSDPETKGPQAPVEKYINNNNNVECKKTVAYKRPRKKFRKRIKKRHSKPNASDSDGSSDEGVPLSRVIELDTAAASPDHAGVPSILILTKDVKPKILPEKVNTKKSELKDQKPDVIAQNDVGIKTVIEKPTEVRENERKDAKRSCNLCSMSFKSERGLKRHLAMSHSVSASDTPARAEREVKPA